jgi:hypothetical protein
MVRPLLLLVLRQRCSSKPWRRGRMPKPGPMATLGERRTIVTPGVREPGRIRRMTGLFRTRDRTDLRQRAGWL